MIAQRELLLLRSQFEKKIIIDLLLQRGLATEAMAAVWLTNERLIIIKSANQALHLVSYHTLVSSHKTRWRVTFGDAVKRLIK